MKIPPVIKGFVAVSLALVMIDCTTLAAPTSQTSAVQDTKSTAQPKSLVYALVSGRLESLASTGSTPAQQVLTALIGMGLSIEVSERFGVLAGIDGSPMSKELFVSGGITYDLAPSFLRVGLRGGGSITTSPALMMSVPIIVLLDDIGLVLDLGATIRTSDATPGGLLGIGGGFTF